MSTADDDALKAKVAEAMATQDFSALQELLPNRWKVRKMNPAIPGAYWIAANPHLMQGKVFPKDQQAQAMDYARTMNDEEQDQERRKADLLKRLEES